MPITPPLDETELLACQLYAAISLGTEDDAAAGALLVRCFHIAELVIAAIVARRSP